ncbi:S-adenosyl-L-methionine-dependent methyltransferases superfamily protein [Tanacetum coccineum]
MSSSSTVTYSSVYTDSEPGRVFWGADEELSDGGSPRVIVYGYDGLPMQPVALPFPDYIPGPEHPPLPVEVPYVLEPEYPEYLVPSDTEAPLEDQPLPADASPTGLSPGYVADSDPDEDPEEDPKEDHADYPANIGDGEDEPFDVKAEMQLIDILCNLEQIYPLAFFDIMIHLVIHLPEEALEGRHIPYRKFPNSDMEQELPRWFELQIRRRYIDKDPTLTDELFALACGPSSIPISVNSCVVNGLRFVVHSRDDRRTTQNNGICSPGEKDGEMYYGQLEENLEFLYISFKSSNGGVIVVEDDHDVIHDNNTSDLALSNSLNDVDFATLNINGQSTEVEAPPNIIAVNEDDDFIDDEDHVPHDLADFDDEVLANADDDDEAATIVYFNVSSSSSAHGGDDGGEPPPNPRVGGRKATRGARGGGIDGGKKGVRKETRILALKKAVDEDGPLKIKFECNDQGTMLQIGPNAVWWSNFVCELVGDFRCNTLPRALSRSPKRRTTKEDSCATLTSRPTCAQSNGLTSSKASSNISPSVTLTTSAP